jgi:transcriptional antiterminator RfaH
LTRRPFGCVLLRLMSYWAVARTMLRREAFAASRLEAAGFEIFAPKIAERDRPAPLFPGYLFVAIVDRWQTIDRTLGVIGLVKAGDHPARCPDAEIAKLRGQVDAAGLIRLRPSLEAFQPGARLRITGGPLCGVDAIYVGMTARQRELVLINLLGRQTPVELDRGLLATTKKIELASREDSRLQRQALGRRRRII